MRTTLTILSTVLILPFINGKYRFDNYTLYKVLPTNVEQIKVLQELYSDIRFEFWSDPMPSVDYVSILSKPGNQEYLEEYLKANQINFIIKMPNIQESIDKETVGTYSRSDSGIMNWTAYYDMDDINAWI
ncbi:hypothetical protein ACJJTC_002301 [Scirpophaga incertulas]